jgi:uncharacterized protein with gpF-like domain
VRLALDGIENDWNALLDAAWATVGTAGGAWLYDDFDDSEAAEALLTIAILAALKERARGISDTTRERIIDALRDSDNAQAAIGGLYDHWTGDDATDVEPRADSIGWDLVVGAWGAGLLLAAGQAETDGHIVSRTWVTAGDAKVRPEHAEAEGQTIGIDDAYDVGGESLAYPGDPTGSAAMIANCRCGEVYSIT